MAILDDIDSMALTPAPEDQESMEGPRFLIEEQLGEGGFGKVYLGEDTRLDRKVAIKVLDREISEVADSAGAAFDEARALAGIEHRHVVPVYDAGRTVKGEVFVVSKFIEGGTLDEALTQGLLSRDEFLRLMLEVCDALAAVHEAGIIHRDIKPDNILLDAEKKAVLIDFGIAATLDGARWLRQAGTPKYMSPEQARGQDHLVDAQSDLYSLGAVLYRGLIGDTLKPESTGEVTSESSDLQMVYRLESLDEQLPPDLAAICQKALAVPKSDRYLSAEAFSIDLKHALEGGKESREAIEEAPVVPRGLRSFGSEDAGFFLKLVPGRREPSSGLPASIHQWKTRIEDRGLSGTEPFRVGLLYGPSGSGKSSLLKAGLLPQLDDSVIVLRFDASSSETEEHFKKVLCQRFPHLDSHESLGWLLGSLRRGGLPTGSKLLIVIDQFEQWLHAHPDNIATSVLTKALRQCDGSRIQALITLRDEFWRPVSQLMRELDAPMRQGENIALVEPFDQAHGRRVLESLGRGLGCLHGELKRNQAAFLDQAIDLVSDGRKVSPLRLSLLAQIFEKRKWTPEALSGIKTREDLGSVYLDHAFYSDDTPLAGREVLAKKFLSALLPEKRSVIRGNGVSEESLKEVLEVDDDEFDELVRILDFDLRLITPVAAEKGRHYQLSHDYLVRALRHWFSDAQKKSMKGLALLRLEDQTEDWLVGDREKLLPKFSEWIWFRVMTPRAARSPEAQQLMGQANRKYYRRAMIWSGAMSVLAAMVFVWVLHGRATDSVDQLFAARPAELGTALEKVDSYSYWTTDLLREEFEKTDNRDRKWRAGVLLAQEGQEYQNAVAQGLLSAHPEEVRAILPHLRPFTQETADYFAKVISEKSHPESGVRAACAMAGQDLSGEVWAKEGGRILHWLDSVEEPLAWVPMLAPVSSHFEEDLRVEVRKGGEHFSRLLAQSKADDLESLLDVLFECVPADTPVFQEYLVKHSQGLDRCREIAGDIEEEHEKRARAIAVLMLSQALPMKIELRDSNLNSQLLYRGTSVASEDLETYLKATKDDPVWQRILMLILEKKDRRLIAPFVYQGLHAHLQEQFRNHPDSGVHSSAELVLRKWDGELPEIVAPEEAKWWISPTNKMTFAILEPPVPLKSGAKRYAFAVSEFNHEMMALASDIDTASKPGYAAAPLQFVNSALQICNILSKKDGFEPCYREVEVEPNSPDHSRFVPIEGYLDLPGYRLPTEEEWLWACMQDSTYPWDFGEVSSEIVPLFVWCRPHSESKFQFGRNLYPNQKGLFDTVGNFEEFMMNDFYSQSSKGKTLPELYELQSQHTYCRGGSARYTIEAFNEFDAFDSGQSNFRGRGMSHATLRVVRTLIGKPQK